MVGGRPKAEIPTVQVSFRLREDEAALLRGACERLGMLPGRLLGRIIRAAFEPGMGDLPPAVVDELMRRAAPGWEGP